MINPNNVNLIIFDMDGTLIPSLPAVYDAIKRTFKRLGWPVAFGPDDIKKFFGLPSSASSGGLYEFITPPGSHLTLAEVREEVLREYESSFRATADTFPGVRHTLETLKKRGYKLALYTNSSVKYLEMVMETLGLAGYFDHVECVQENGLTKPELARKIIERFGGLKAAVVGDRIHDIETARATGSLSVGILFGYGGDEPEGADIAIASFDELLDIFDRRRAAFERLLGEIDGRKEAGRPYVVGISGVDCSGKTVFAEAFEKYLESQGRPIQLVSLDDFHQPLEVRHPAGARDEDYYDRVKQGRVFDFKRVIDELLAPARRGEPFRKELALLDLRTDGPNLKKTYNIGGDTIVVLEGVYLLFPEISPYIDFKVFLQVPLDIWRERAGARDPEEVFARYETRYIPAQRKYLAEFPPEKHADIIIDNSNYEYPCVLSGI